MKIFPGTNVRYASVIFLPLTLRLVHWLIGAARDCIDDIDHTHHSQAARIRCLLLWWRWWWWWLGVMCLMVDGWVRPRRHKYRRLLRVHGWGWWQLRCRRSVYLRWVEHLRGRQRLERLVVIWWRQNRELSRVLALRDVVHNQARCLRLLLSFPLQLLLDRLRALMGVVVSVDPIEPTEKPFAAPHCGGCGCCGFGPLPFLCPPLCPLSF
jgi:hypothetical protein